MPYLKAVFPITVTRGLWQSGHRHCITLGVGYFAYLDVFYVIFDSLKGTVEAAAALCQFRLCSKPAQC